VHLFLQAKTEEARAANQQLEQVRVFFFFFTTARFCVLFVVFASSTCPWACQTIIVKTGSGDMTSAKLKRTNRFHTQALLQLKELQQQEQAQQQEQQEQAQEQQPLPGALAMDAASVAAPAVAAIGADEVEAEAAAAAAATAAARHTQSAAATADNTAAVEPAAAEPAAEGGREELSIETDRAAATLALELQLQVEGLQQELTTLTEVRY
jgi:hypothetical protein